MADEPQTPAPASSVQDIGGGAMRVTPNTGEPQKTVAEEAAEQAKAGEAKPAGGEQAPQQQQQEPAKPKEGEGAPDPVDLAGTVFDGMSPEMQGKIAPFAAAFSENGTLTEAEVKEAAHATGFSEAAVRQFMAGATATAEASTKPVYDQFGGTEGYGEFQQWTVQPGNLTAVEERNINKALGIGADGKPDPKLTPDYEMAAQLMAPAKARWQASGGGGAARDVTGEGAGGGGGGQQNVGDVYGSWAQVQKDMSKPEYDKDPAFRKQVEQKIARSPAIG